MCTALLRNFWHVRMPPSTRSSMLRALFCTFCYMCRPQAATSGRSTQAAASSSSDEDLAGAATVSAAETETGTSTPQPETQVGFSTTRTLVCCCFLHKKTCACTVMVCIKSLILLLYFKVRGREPTVTHRTVGLITRGLIAQPV